MEQGNRENQIIQLLEELSSKVKPADLKKVFNRVVIADQALKVARSILKSPKGNLAKLEEYENCFSELKSGIDTKTDTQYPEVCLALYAMIYQSECVGGDVTDNSRWFKSKMTNLAKLVEIDDALILNCFEGSEDEEPKYNSNDFWNLSELDID